MRLPAGQRWAEGSGSIRSRRLHPNPGLDNSSADKMGPGAAWGTVALSSGACGERAVPAAGASSRAVPTRRRTPARCLGVLFCFGRRACRPALWGSGQLLSRKGKHSPPSSAWRRAKGLGEGALPEPGPQSAVRYAAAPLLRVAVQGRLRARWFQVPRSPFQPRRPERPLGRGARPGLPPQLSREPPSAGAGRLRGAPRRRNAPRGCWSTAAGQAASR